MIKINIKNLTNLVEAMEAIDQETKGNDFYGCYIEYKKPVTLLMTEFYFSYPNTYDIYSIELFNEYPEAYKWTEVLARYIGFTRTQHMIRWFNMHPKIWTKQHDFNYFVEAMITDETSNHAKTKAQRVTEQWRDILDLLIKEKK
jgi:hypothetical protein